MAGVQGILGSQSDIENVWGVSSVAQWSNPGGYVQGQAANANTVTAAINATDSFIIQQFFTAGNYSYPLQPGTYAQGMVTRWFGVIGGYYLEAARGLTDTKSIKTRQQFVEVCGLMAFYASGAGRNRLQANMRWPVADCPTSG